MVEKCAKEISEKHLSFNKFALIPTFLDHIHFRMPQTVTFQFLVFFFYLLVTTEISVAQNSRITDENSIGWYALTGILTLDKKIGIQGEYHFRRDEIITKWQQGLFKIAMNYQLHPRLQFRLGYGLAETFPYGDIPINSFGKKFTEHRIFEAITINDNIGIAGLSNRFMLEQRWIGKYSNQRLKKEDGFTYVNRFRYMLRIQLPLNNTKMQDHTLYLAAYNEVMLGFGRNINENVFDQNRLGVMAGYNLNTNVKFEAGYLLQVAQLGREINGRNVFQYNKGLLVNALINLEFSKKSPARR